MKRSKSQVKQSSRAAVAKAGSRERRAPVKSAGAWTPRRGKNDGPFRPGKTAHERRRGA